MQIDMDPLGFLRRKSAFQPPMPYTVQQTQPNNTPTPPAPLNREQFRELSGMITEMMREQTDKVTPYIVQQTAQTIKNQLPETRQIAQNTVPLNSAHMLAQQKQILKQQGEPLKNENNRDPTPLKSIMKSKQSVTGAVHENDEKPRKPRRLTETDENRKDSLENESPKNKKRSVGSDKPNSNLYADENNECDLEVTDILESSENDVKKEPKVQAKKKIRVPQFARAPSRMSLVSGRMSRNRRGFALRSPQPLYRHWKKASVAANSDAGANENCASEISKKGGDVVETSVLDCSVKKKSRLRTIANKSKRLIRKLTFPVLCVSGAYFYSKYGSISQYAEHSMALVLTPIVRSAIRILTKTVLENNNDTMEDGIVSDVCSMDEECE